MYFPEAAGLRQENEVGQIDLTVLAEEPETETFDDAFQQRERSTDLAAELERLAKEEEAPPAAAQPQEPPLEVELPPDEQVEEVAAERAGPEVRDLGEGRTLTIEKSKGVWNLTLNSGNGSPEVFKGATKAEAYERMAAGKAEATALIRKQNRKIKEFERFQDTPPPPAAAPVAQRQRAAITAEDVVEIRTLLNSNPLEALDSYFKKRFGWSADELAEKLSRGDRAASELDAAAVARKFVQQTPDFHPNQHNYGLLLKELAKTFLGGKLRRLTDENHEQVCEALYTGGHWTVENLSNAFVELDEDALFESVPTATPEHAPVVAPETPVPPARPAVSQRIVGETRRASAGFGVKPGAVSVPAPVEDIQPPSVEEDLESLSEEQLLARIGRLRNLHLNSQARR